MLTHFGYLGNVKISPNVKYLTTVLHLILEFAALELYRPQW